MQRLGGGARVEARIEAIVRGSGVFRDVSVYDFQQPIEDRATVPNFYENRTPELQLVNPDLNDEIYDLIERADLDLEQKARPEEELSRQYHLITRDHRLDTVAKAIARHFIGRGVQSRAMAVSIGKATALRVRCSHLQPGRRSEQRTGYAPSAA